MSTEANAELVRRARRHAALGDPARLAIVDRLLLGDASPSELGRALGLPSNLLAHHLKRLEEADLVRRSRSEGDHRRAYLRLNAAALAQLGPGERLSAPRVVFVCTRNSARSQLAAALWRECGGVPVASAGTEPADGVHPLAVDAARRHGLSLAGARTARVSDVLHPDDLVVVVCDTAHEQLGTLAARRLHWSVPDPARGNDSAAFDETLHDLSTRVHRLAPVVQPTGVTA